MTSRHGRRGREIHGILLFDKPSGLSSNDALQRVKQLFQARKAGHTGSLDLLATGLLPLCFGEATKLSGFLLGASKRYLVTIKLGVSTTTGDAEGEVTREVTPPRFERDTLAAMLASFTGRVRQIPPMHSAIKQRGRPLYELAHRGITIPRPARTVVIHVLSLLRYENDDLDIAVDCSKGTYIRTLAADIGERLGCGAHVGALRRVGVGPFDIGAALDLEALQRLAQGGTESLMPTLLDMACVLYAEPPIALSQDAAYYLSRGQPVMVPHAPDHGLVRLYDQHKRFLGVGQVLEDGRIAPRRLLRR